MRRAVFRDSVNEVIHMEADNHDDSQDLVPHLTSNLINNLSFVGPIIHLVKALAQVAIADEAKPYDHILAQLKQSEQPFSS